MRFDDFRLQREPARNDAALLHFVAMWIAFVPAEALVYEHGLIG
jgi:hypothetical protein